MPQLKRASACLLIAGLSGNTMASGGLDDVTKMNRAINAIGYRDDSIQFGVNDYWQTPTEFKANGFGDCEDFAIAKYFALKEMGKQDVYLHYAMTQQGAHMVVSYVDDVGVRFALDNRNNLNRPFDSLDDLKIVWSFDQQGVWVGELPNGKIYPMNIQRFSRILKAEGHLTAR